MNVKLSRMVVSAVMMAALLSTSCQGPIGPQGPQGPQGPAGLTVQDDRLCAGIDSGDTYSFLYQWVVYTNGAVWATCEVYSRPLGHGYSSSFYSRAGTTEAAQKFCAVLFDIDAPMNGGLWTFTTAPNGQVVYTDNGSPNDGFRLVLACG